MATQGQFRISYSFLVHAFAQPTGQPLEIDRRFHHPRHSRYIQPKFRLEVVVNTIGDFPRQSP